MSSNAPTLEDYFEESDTYSVDDMDEIPDEKQQEINAALSELQSE